MRIERGIFLRPAIPITADRLADTRDGVFSLAGGTSFAGVVVATADLGEGEDQQRRRQDESAALQGPSEHQGLRPKALVRQQFGRECVGTRAI
jgi:hypothetical protein